MLTSRSALSFCLLVLSLAAGAPAEEQTPPSRLTFKNSGVVQSTMRFEYKTQPCYYVESPTAWSVPWGQVTGGSSYPYLYLVESRGGASQLVPPPLGMRSAVPLGGLGAGTVELRADGSLRDWNIFNNSPASGQKVQLDDALFGLWVKAADAPARAWTLRTQPPHGLPPVAQLEYAGAFPVSRLRCHDPNLPLTVALYAYSEFKIRDAAASATPAIVFTFELSNPSSKATEAAILFTLPNHVQGKFSVVGGLRLARDGHDPTNGAMLLRFDGKRPVSCGVGDDLGTLWQTFATSGGLGDQPVSDSAGKLGAIAARLDLKPHETQTINLVMAWRFPDRRHGGNKQRVGNYYTKLYKSVDEVAEKVLARLPQTWASFGRVAAVVLRQCASRMASGRADK